MSQSEKEYCLAMTNENARMRRILGRLSIAYASKQLLGSIQLGIQGLKNTFQDLMDGQKLSMDPW